MRSISIQIQLEPSVEIYRAFTSILYNSRCLLLDALPRKDKGSVKYESFDLGQAKQSEPDRGLRQVDLAIRAASLREDRQELIALLERNIPGKQTRHFQWRHEDNPAGPGWSWVIYDRSSGAASAMASVYPRQMYIDGKQVLCGQVGEFVVDSTLRSLGPAVMLQRATFDPVDTGEVELCYDCPPHAQGMSTFVRLGMSPSCEVFRYALLLRSDEYLEKRVGTGAWSKPMVAAANLLLGMRARKGTATGLEIDWLDGRFGEEFSELDKLVPSSGVIRASRSAEVLNWRYRTNPELTFRVLVARQAGELLGFLVFVAHDDKRVSICDLFGRELSDAGPALLEAAAESCRKGNLNCLQGYCSATSALRPLFERVGLRKRERAVSIVAYAKANGPAGLVLSSPGRWPAGHAEMFST